MESFTRPSIVVSKCLGFARCRYNGEVINDPFAAKLQAWADLRPVCPEMEIGLGVPRHPVRLVEGPQGLRLTQPASGQDCTQAMIDFARDFAAGLGPVEGFLLKSRSPSCGTQDVKIYASGKQGSASRRGQGLFTREMRALMPRAAFEHEGRAKNFHLREHFLTRIFALARLRELLAQPSPGRLVEFHAQHKLLLMAYHQAALRKMGTLVANPGGLAPGEQAAAYAQLFSAALARAPQAPAVINVLMHGLGYFKKALAAREKAYFLDLLDQYRQGRVPLLVLQGVLMAWALRFGVEYLCQQTFFAPYPREIFDMADSGQGRELP